MTVIKTGGAAFPGNVAFSAADDLATSENVGQPGMTLRDYFASSMRELEELSIEYAEALCGREMPHKRAAVGLSNVDATIAIMKFWAEAEARYRFIRADAMIVAREGGS